MATLSQIERDSILKVFVQDEKTMPPNADLNDQERNAVVDCLNEEYFGYKSENSLLEKWFGFQ